MDTILRWGRNNLGRTGESCSGPSILVHPHKSRHPAAEYWQVENDQRNTDDMAATPLSLRLV